MQNQLEKIARVAQMMKKSNTTLQVDGGINIQTAELCVQQGANVLVAGSAVFKAANPTEVINKMKNLRRE